MSTLLKKSFRDLSRRRSRTIFTILTIALGVMGLSLFSVNLLADKLVSDEIDRENVHNLLFTIDDIELNETNKRDLECLDNVESFEGRSVYTTKIYNGDRREHAYLIGIDDLTDQKVDRILFDSDERPLEDELLTEKSNAKYGLYNGEKGDSISVASHNGDLIEMRISGEGRSLVYARGGFISGTTSMFYADIDTVRDLGNLSGYNSLSFTLDRTDDISVEATILEITAYLTEELGSDLRELPEVRKDGEWSMSGVLEIIMNLMYVLTFLALFCSVFLISNTMNTIVSEERREISQMKAVGATRAQVFSSYLLTSLILGVIGSMFGIGLGIFMPYLVLSFLSNLFGFDPVFMTHLPTLGLSFLCGIGIVLLSSIPALIKTTRITVKQGMEGPGINGGYSKGILSACLIRFKWIPRSVQMGIRNVTRRKGRSFTTVAQITLAVGVFLGLVAFSHSLGIAISREIDNHGYDIEVEGLGESSIFIDERVIESIETVEGVKHVEPSLQTYFKVNDKEIYATGYRHDTLSKRYDRTLSSGRWFTPDDISDRSKVVVVASTLAMMDSIHLGDTITATTSTGDHSLEVIGIDDDWDHMGMAIYLPFETMQDLLDEEGNVSGFYIITESREHSDIDRASSAIDDLLEEKGIPAEVKIMYVSREANVEENRGIVDMMIVTSLIIVMICMIGLMNNLSMNIMERTREIGMMRCIGSLSRDIRHVFGSEGLLLAFMGWIAGIPFGYLIARVISHMLVQMMDFTVDIHYPVSYIFWSLAVTMLGAIIIMQIPIWRASRMKPGDALRYQ